MLPLSLLAPMFAIAGLAVAAGPIIIHLLNRRRYKVVEWAAMDFLREAIHRNKRILQIQDLLLLALRTLCLILFGLALAQPYLSGKATAGNPNQPVHAVLLMDNSLSMSCQKLDGTLLQEAKAKAREYIATLPRGSRITILPTCGMPGGLRSDAYFSADDALEALDEIRTMDQETRPRETIDLALDAIRRVPVPAQKQVVLFADRQVSDWPVDSLRDHLNKVPGGIKVIEVQADAADVENAWVSDFRLRDGVADLQSPAMFVATIEYEGVVARRDVSVTLSIDGQVVQSPVVDLQPGQKREVEFSPYQFDAPAEPGKPYYATAEVALPPDRLPTDDRRVLVVPVVATLPVVFVDQYGKDENPRRNRYGETFLLRRLLAPVTSQAEKAKQLIRVDHRTIDEIEPSVLEDARLVVIAGVASPGAAVPVLRQYVEQGGNLVIAAGGLFDPSLWTQDAWLKGQGILPAPLEPVTVGRLPEEAADQVEFFQLDFDSIKGRDYFALEGASSDELRDLYAKVFFFKAVEAQVSSETRQAAVDSTRSVVEASRVELGDIDRKLEALRTKAGGGRLAANDQAQMEQLERQRGKIEPNWLLWKGPEPNYDPSVSPQDIAEDSRPNVAGRYTSGLPFLVERRIGRGRVLLATSGLYAEWNTLSLSDAVVVYDRIFRGMLSATLAQRNFSTEQEAVLPVHSAERSARFLLSSEDQPDQTLLPEAAGADRFVVRVPPRTTRGIYRVTAMRTKETVREGLDAKLWEIPLAFNGPAVESKLGSEGDRSLRKRTGQGDSLDTAESLSAGLERAEIARSDYWKWALIAVLCCLAAEMAILTRPFFGGGRAA